MKSFRNLEAKRRRYRRRKNSAQVRRRPMGIEPLEDRQLLSVGPQLIGINNSSIKPNVGELIVQGSVLDEAPTGLTFLFDANQQIDPTTLDGIRISRANFDGDLDNGNEISIDPGFVGIGQADNQVVVRFAETLPDDLYRIEIIGSGSDALANIEGDVFNNGHDVTVDFELELGAQVVAVIPQPITRGVSDQLVQRKDQIIVHFDESDPLQEASATNPGFYQLIFVNDTVTNTDDTVHLPTSVVYDASSNTAVLTFSDDIDQLSTGAGTYRLRIGTAEELALEPVTITIAQDPGSSFDTANTALGTLDRQGIIISSAIEPQEQPLDYPGASDGIGHRGLNLLHNTHLLAGADDVDGVTTFPYSFREVYGQDDLGNPRLNLITDRQKQRTREVLDLYGYYLGVQFYETELDGLAIVTGNPQAVDPGLFPGAGGEIGIYGDIAGYGPTVILDAAETWEDSFGENWFQETMRQVGHYLGLGDTFDLPEGTIQGSDPTLNYLRGLFPADAVSGADPQLRLLTDPEPVFPGDHDIVHGQYLHRPDSNDIDLYRFDITEAGSFTAETIAERQANSSLLDTVVRLYQETTTGRKLIAQNDDYFSEDSLLSMQLNPGTYYLGISASGNDQYDPVIEDTGAGGTSQGVYDLRLQFHPTSISSLKDVAGTALDGNANGDPGGVYNFWFRAQGADKSIYVDKSFEGVSDGSLANPYSDIPTALAVATPGDIVRAVGSGGTDGDLATLSDNPAFEVGFDALGNTLSDGRTIDIPQDVTLVVDAGAVFKMRRSQISVGSSTATTDRSGATLQVLGSPQVPVLFTSADAAPSAGDWGGIVIRNDVDQSSGRFVFENEGIFVNYVNHADLRYGGGVPQTGSSVINPIHIVDARPTISFNTITQSADAALSATPNSFLETNFHSPEFQTVPFTSDYDRVGPKIHHNRITENTTNALFINIPQQESSSRPEPLVVSARLDDIDVVHVLQENLILQGTPGGAVANPDTGNLDARLDASLVVDPGIVIKASGSRIEAQIGTTFYAEGTGVKPVVFTSIQDDSFGAGGTFDTNNDTDLPEPGNWAGIILEHTATGSLDNTIVTYAGGVNRIEGSFSATNALEIHQANARVTNSIFEFNARGVGGLAPDNRFGRGFNMPATIFVRGAQPIIVGNTFESNDGPVVNINANALNHQIVTDIGRNTGNVDQIQDFSDNQGPLIRNNLIGDNRINGMQVRGGTLTTESVWDDTDIVHYLRDAIFIPDLHTFGGLRLESSSAESLVVKLLGDNAGFTATGRPLEINDRIGGRINIVGQPGQPVIITSLDDDTAGAGFDTQGQFQTDTNNGGRPVRTEPVDSFQIDINFGPVILSDPIALAAVETAVSLWEQVIEDPITVTFDFEFAALPPGVLGGAASEFVPLDYNTVRSAMISDAGDHESYIAGLPTFEVLEANVVLPQNPLNPFTLSQEMSVTRANAKALGFSDSSLPGPPSQFDPTVIRDADIEFTNTPGTWDFDRKDGIAANRSDFLAVVVHEIGHALGFVSAVDDVDGALANAALNRDISVNPLDLFRLKPGDGQDDFTNAPRQYDPRFTDVPRFVEHVFYDGGFYDPTGIAIEKIDTGDIPLSRGQIFGDESQASHWKDNSLTGGVLIGIMDPTVFGTDPIDVREENLLNNLKEADRIAFDRIGWDVVGGGGPGDWQGIVLEQYSHDGNVAVLNEMEPADIAAPGTNSTPVLAELAGRLAPDAKSGDDNLRLGFEIHGMISEPADVDVYRFTGIAGTEIWLDIDRTSSTLDSVIELIDEDGNALARSDNSLAETLGTEDLVGVLNPQPMGGTDHYSTNVLDAGMRVVLPGPTGTENVYHLRVRSSGPDLDGNLAGGLTFGQYQLQLRLRSTDEFPGSSVSYADIRYAEIGVEIIGQPTHSLLAGEVVEDGSWNDVMDEPGGYAWGPRFFPAGRPSDDPVLFGPSGLPPHIGPQQLGNLLNSDRGGFSVFGSLDSPIINVDLPFFTDVDWYKFDVQFDAVQNVLTTTGVEPQTAGVVLDIDYADGLSRPNTVMSVFDQFGTLIYYSDGSNVPADLPEFITNGDPTGPSDLDDLSRGSVSTSDPFIGPIELTEGSYFVVISSVDAVPASINDGTAARRPIIPGETGRGDRVSDVTFDSSFVVNDSAPDNPITTGEYQLEIRYTDVPENGFDSTNANILDKNLRREQGQIVIASSTISNSSRWGILVNDGRRDLSGYQQTDSSIFSPQHPHGQQPGADYAPHGGTPRSLVETNKERLVPGLTIKNNLIVGGIDGGIHFKGDPNGLVIRTFDLKYPPENNPVGIEPLHARITDQTIDGMAFVIIDNHGNEEFFEFDSDNAVAAGNIPIRFDLNTVNDPPISQTEFPRPLNPPTLAENIASELFYQIRSTNLDVDVLRGESDTLFIEGAVAIAPVAGHTFPFFPLFEPFDPHPITGITEIVAPLPSTSPILTLDVAQQGPVPFGRIVNNTLVGRGGDLFDGVGANDIGILVEDNASPTIMNNIIANFTVGLQSDPTSTDAQTDHLTFIGSDVVFDIRSGPTKYVAPRPTVIGGTVFQGNLLNTSLLSEGDFAIDLEVADPNDNDSVPDPLFVDAANGNFLLEEGSRAIDSSIDELDEREDVQTVTGAVGIPASAILAPDFDLRGQLRVDDPSVEPPEGFGQTVFKDRGALDRVDFAGPAATLVSPVDNDAAGNDQDPSLNSVALLGGSLSEFSIKIVDGVAPADPGFGTGTDDLTVTAETVTISVDNMLLVEGLDYTFSYNSTSDTIRLTSTAGVWPLNTTAPYLISLDNSEETGIADRAGNPLRANQTDGTTQFRIFVGDGFDFGDAPTPPYKTLLVENGARHKIVNGMFLGEGLTLEADGKPSIGADADDLDDGVVFDAGALIPGFEATITVTASVPGRLDGWIDLNADGIWSVSDQLVNSIPLAAGENSISLGTIPSTATKGDTYARFRFTTSGISSPNGLAPDGEVEDYLVRIISSPWTNPNNIFDVNGSGEVSPTDALAVLNELNNFAYADPADGSLPIPAPADHPFFDVNGDGYISPVDALRVLRELDRLNNGGTPAVPMAETVAMVTGAPVSPAPSLRASALDPSLVALPNHRVFGPLRPATVPVSSELDTNFFSEDVSENVSLATLANVPTALARDAAFGDFRISEDGEDHETKHETGLADLEDILGAIAGDIGGQWS